MCQFGGRGLQARVLFLIHSSHPQSCHPVYDGRMTASNSAARKPTRRSAAKSSKVIKRPAKELVIVTGISGAGKASALKSFEDLGYHAVDNLPLELLTEFAGLVGKSTEIERAVIVVDIREGQTLDRLPDILTQVKQVLPTRVVFLDAQDAVLVRRYSETRRPHPLRRSDTVERSIVEERQLLDPIRNVADTLIDTSNFNVHELRAQIQSRFGHEDQTKKLLVSCLSFGFKNGVPLDADLVFDVRFLPNPHFRAGVPQKNRQGSPRLRLSCAVSRRPRSFWARSRILCCICCRTMLRKARVI